MYRCDCFSGQWSEHEQGSFGLVSSDTLTLTAKTLESPLVENVVRPYFVARHRLSVIPRDSRTTD
jgi:hypothetical protein